MLIIRYGYTFSLVICGFRLHPVYNILFGKTESIQQFVHTTGVTLQKVIVIHEPQSYVVNPYFVV